MHSDFDRGDASVPDRIRGSIPHQSDALEARGCYQVESTTVLPPLPSRHDRLSKGRPSHYSISVSQEPLAAEPNEQVLALPTKKTPANQQNAPFPALRMGG